MSVYFQPGPKKVAPTVNISSDESEDEFVETMRKERPMRALNKVKYVISDEDDSNSDDWQISNGSDSDF